MWSFKVAEHSFSVRFCWCKLARAQGFQKTNMLSTEQSFYLLNNRTICVITWASQRESPRLKMLFVIFFLRLQSQIAVWALICMRACLIRGRGIDLQGFIQCCMQSLGSFRRNPPWASFVKLADWVIMVSLAKCLFAQNWGRIFSRWQSGHL